MTKSCILCVLIHAPSYRQIIMDIMSAMFLTNKVDIMSAMFLTNKVDIMSQTEVENSGKPCILANLNRALARVNTMRKI